MSERDGIEVGPGGVGGAGGVGDAGGVGVAGGTGGVALGDTPAIAKRRVREMRTISQMIALHCAGCHGDRERSLVAHCGEPVCAECFELDAYGVLRTRRCRRMGEKTSCEKCGNHCYKPEMRERIREAMRYSGPRMMTKHPVAAVRHLLGK